MGALVSNLAIFCRGDIPSLHLDIAIFIAGAFDRLQVNIVYREKQVFSRLSPFLIAVKLSAPSDHY